MMSVGGIRLLALLAPRPAELADELFGHQPRLFVGVLHGRRLHEVRRRAEQRTAQAGVHGELRAADGVDDHARRIG